MFGKIGIQELILILALALIIFGPRKLPELGRSIGQGIREFRKATTEVKKSVSFDADVDDEGEELKKENKAEKAPVAEKAQESSQNEASPPLESETESQESGEKKTENV